MLLPVHHYNDVIMGAIASQITSLTIVYSIVYSDADQRKHQSSASLAFVLGIHRGPVNSPQSPVNSPHKWPVTRKMFPFDDVIMWLTFRKLTFIKKTRCLYRQSHYLKLWIGKFHTPIAQRLEHSACNRWVVGSRPTRSVLSLLFK